MVGCARKVGRGSVHSKDVTWNVIATSHCLKSGGIRGENCSKLRMAIFTWRSIHTRNGEVVDHPAFVPAAFIVDYKHRIDVGEDVDEGTRVVRIGREPGLRFQDYTHGADRGHPAVRAGDRQLHVVID